MININIKFVGIDYWNRAIYKIENINVFIGNVNKLFDLNSNKNKVDSYCKMHLNQFIIFGNKFDCEPLGTPIKNNIILKII